LALLIYKDYCYYDNSIGDVMSERWGKKFIDKRGWVEYNEELVVRGEFLLDMGWVKSWDKELEEMNKGKAGAPYQFPESLIKLQAVWYQWVDYRGLEGITRKLSALKAIPKYNDYTTIFRRVEKTDVEFELPKEGIVFLSTDGSGFKTGNNGTYMERLYGNKRKKYIKITISANPMTKDLLKCDVSIEGEGESEPETAEKHMKELIDSGKTIDKFWGDGAFDTLSLFNFLDKHNIEAAIKPRKLDTSNAPDSYCRKKAIEKFKEKGYKKWAKEKQYGLRWLGTEGIFSAVKRKYGENTRAHKIENMLLSAKMKFWAYECMRKYART